MARPLRPADGLVYLSIARVAELMEYPPTPEGHHNCRRILKRMLQRRGMTPVYFGRSLRITNAQLADLLHPSRLRLASSKTQQAS